MNFFDTHFHLNPNDDLSGIVTRATESGVNRMLIAGTTADQTENMLDIITQYPNLYAAIGIHPHQAQCRYAIKTFRKNAENQSVKAIGEIGLDYYYNNAPKEKQVNVFREFLELSKEIQIPAIIHCRDAFSDCYEIVSEILQGKHPFVVHCFTGSEIWAEKFINIGGYLSFNGIITFKNSDSIRSVMKKIPRCRLLFETDSPYLAPVPYRGKKNEPSYLPCIMEKASQTLETDINELSVLSTENAMRFFNIPCE